MSLIPALYSGSPMRSNVAGPPFIPTSADNGLSIDTISGRVVLGQNVGQAGNPARLLNNREIPLNTFQLNLQETVNSTLIRFNNAPLNPVLIQANVNNQWSNVIAQNLNAGNQATSFLGVYNNLGNNMSIVKTSSTYAGPFGFPVNTGILYSSSVGGLGTDAMAFVSEAGFYWSPNTTGAGGISQTSMQMLTNGRLQLFPIGTSTMTDNGQRLQIFGSASVSGYALGAIRQNNALFAVAMTDSNNQGICIQKSTNNVNGPIFVMYKSRGTDPNVPVANVVSDQLGRMIFQGVAADNLIKTTAEIRCNAVQINATTVSTTFSIFTTSFAGVFANRYFFGADGDLGINTGAFLTPGSNIKFQVNGGMINMAGLTNDTYRWNVAAAAPAVTAGPVFANYYGGNTNALGDPVEWVLINVNGTDRKIPVYAV